MCTIDKINPEKDEASESEEYSEEVERFLKRRKRDDVEGSIE